MRQLSRVAVSLGSLAVVTWLYADVIHVTNGSIVSLTFLLIVLVVAATSTVWIAVTTALAATVAFNFFFLPPVGALRIEDPQNWVALFTFLGVCLIATIAIERAHLLEARKAADLARQSEELKSALLASLGHDLRTPLTAIRVAASNLQASWLTPEDRIGQTDIVLSEVERLTRLFQNILDMARIDAGAVSAEERWVHPAEIVDAARDLVPHALRERCVRVSMGADRMVHVDPRLTAAALSQLLENAAQYSPPGTAIEIEASVANEQVTLTVRDHGLGIPEVDLPHLFDRFYRGGNVKKRVAGTGMGLSIARGLVAAEHGRIWAENRPDGGAAFTIALAAQSKQIEASLVDADA